MKEDIYRNIKKRKTNQIIDKLKRLKRLKRSNLAKKENIFQNELDEIKRLSDFLTKILKKLVQLRNIEAAGLNRSDLIYTLMRSQKHHKEAEYLSYLQAEPINEIKSKSNNIRKPIIKLGMMINKSDRDIIRKRLEEIDKKNKKQIKDK